MPTRTLTAAAALLALGLAGCRRAPPTRTARPLIDQSAVLDAAAGARIDRYLRFVRREYGIDYRVVVAGPSEQGTAEREAERWFRELGLGGATEGRGLLLWIDPARRLARIEVGYALEPHVPDVSAAWILDAYLAPRVRAEELPASLEAAIEGVVDRIRPRLAEVSGASGNRGSGGAGAATDLGRATGAGDGGGLEMALGPQPEPRATRDLELRMMAAGRYDPAAAIYDATWQRTGRAGHWSPERLREIARLFDRPYETEREGDHAIAYYRDAPGLGPTLLRREPAGWVIDATAGARLIVYDFSNASWYAIDEPSPYLELLHRVYRLDRVQLQGGRPAWRVARPAG